jgi:hypothetical protein
VSIVSLRGLFFYPLPAIAPTKTREPGGKRLVLRDSSLFPSDELSLDGSGGVYRRSRAFKTTEDAVQLPWILDVLQRSRPESALHRRGHLVIRA